MTRPILLALVCLPLSLALGLAALGRTIYPYPTLAEVVRKAADAHARGKLTPAVRRAFRLFFRVVG